MGVVRGWGHLEAAEESCEGAEDSACSPTLQCFGPFHVWNAYAKPVSGENHSAGQTSGAVGGQDIGLTHDCLRLDQITFHRHQ